LTPEEQAIARYNANLRNNYNNYNDLTSQKKVSSETQTSSPSNQSNHNSNRNQILSAHGTQLNNSECSKECNGQMPVRTVCFDERANRIIDNKYCPPNKFKTEYKPCNTHCRFV
jgi:hypothetical protein